MTSIHEIQQVMWVTTPHGDGQAMFLLDYGPHEDCVFLVALEQAGDLKHYTARQLKICRNHTFDIGPRTESIRFSTDQGWSIQTRGATNVVTP